MIRTIRACAGLLALTACCVAMVVTAPVASAQLVQREHNQGTVVFEENICGVDVITTIHFIDNFQERIGHNGFPLFQSTGRTEVTWFNPATGLSMTNIVSGTNYKYLSDVDNGDGTITVREAVSGIPEQLRLPDGTVAVKDVGRIVFVVVLDYNGTPTDTADDVFISSTVEQISGPHPDAESDFTLFCPTVIDGLT